MSKKPILVVPIVRAEQDFHRLLAKAGAGVRVFIEQDKRLAVELRALDVTAASTTEVKVLAPLQAAEGSLGLRDRARELFRGQRCGRFRQCLPVGLDGSGSAVSSPCRRT
jgi:hypothetical protein